jgi:hypothetical protein
MMVHVDQISMKTKKTCNPQSVFTLLHLLLWKLEEGRFFAQCSCVCVCVCVRERERESLRT